MKGNFTIYKEGKYFVVKEEGKLGSVSFKTEEKAKDFIKKMKKEYKKLYGVERDTRTSWQKFKDIFSF